MGNVVQVSPDDKYVYAVLDDGALSVLSAEDGSKVGGYDPKTSLSGITSGTTVTCGGGVDFGRNPAGLLTDRPFAVYSVSTVGPTSSISTR